MGQKLMPPNFIPEAQKHKLYSYIYTLIKHEFNV